MVRAAKSKIAKKEKNDRLYKAILMLKDEEECYNFFQDLCTVGAALHGAALRGGNAPERRHDL